MSDRIKAGLSHCASNKDCKECPYFDLFSQLCFKRIATHALAYIRQLEAKVPQWISVRERSPEKHQRVLFISTGHERVCVGNYHGEGKKGGHYFLAGNRLETAKWWMPTPEFPEEEK